MTVTCTQSQGIQLLVYGHKRTDKTEKSDLSMNECVVKFNTLYTLHLIH